MGEHEGSRYEDHLVERQDQRNGEFLAELAEAPMPGPTLEVWNLIIFTEGGDVTALRLPVGAVLLDAQRQGEHVTLWALVDPDQQAREVRLFYLAQTNAAFPRAAGHFLHVATVQQQWGYRAQHLFELKMRPGSALLLAAEAMLAHERPHALLLADYVSSEAKAPHAPQW